MPTYRDVVVEVTDAENKALTEYGVRKRDRARLTSCYIQSQTDMPFRIRIKPQVHLIPQMVDSDKSDNEPSEDEIDACKRTQRVRDRPRPPQPPKNPREAPWHLLATLRLDGRKEAEKRSIVYLDDAFANVEVYRGEIIMKCRTVKDADGRLRDCGWLFREVGIESVFHTLRLGGDGEEQDAVPTQENDDFLNAFSGLGANLEDAEEKSTAGQIEIILERVKLGRIIHDTWKGNRGESIDVDMSASDVANISHAVARDHGERKDDVVKFIVYDLVDPEEQPYATFRFYYRSEDILRKFNFPGFESKAPVSKSLRERKGVLSKIPPTPLSILNSKPVRYFFNKKGEVIGEEEIQVVDLTESKETTDKIPSDRQLWVPKSIRIPTITIRDGPEDQPASSPPDSPAQDSEDTTIIDPSGKTSTITPHSARDDGEQSSADESTPFKPLNGKVKQEAMTRFRMVNAETTEGEEADDEASDGGRTPTSMGFRDDNGDAVGNDVDGISRDEPDEGLSADLDKVQIGSKRIGDDEYEGEVDGATGTSKKARVVDSASEDQEVGQTNDEEL